MLSLRFWESLCRSLKPTGRPTRTTPTPVSRWSPYDRTSRWVFTGYKLSFVFLCQAKSNVTVLRLLFFSRFREFGLNSRWKCMSVTHASLWKRWFVLTVWPFEQLNAPTTHLLNSWMFVFRVTTRSSISVRHSWRPSTKTFPRRILESSQHTDCCIIFLPETLEVCRGVSTLFCVTFTFVSISEPWPFCVSSQISPPSWSTWPLSCGPMTVWLMLSLFVQPGL